MIVRSLPFNHLKQFSGHYNSPIGTVLETPNNFSDLCTDIYNNMVSIVLTIVFWSLYILVLSTIPRFTQL